MRSWVYIAGGVGVAAAGAAAFWLMKPSPEAVLQEQWAMLDRYCVDCHNDAELTADLSFEGRGPDDVHSDPAVWEEVLRKLKIHAMPPRQERQPAAEMVAEFVEGLEGTLDAAAAANPYAGSTTVHRLNRAEYANAVRDMLGVEADLSSLLPSDGGDFGFDNIAEVLTTSPLLLERYLTVALRVADMAVGNPDAAVTATAYRIPFELTQDKHLDGMPLGTRGGTRVTAHVPRRRRIRVFGPPRPRRRGGSVRRRRARSPARVPDSRRRQDGLLGRDRRCRASRAQRRGRLQRRARCRQRENDVAASSDHRWARTKSHSPGRSALRASRTRGSRGSALRSRRTTRPACRGSRTESSKVRTT